MARTTDHATITEGEGAPSGSFFFAASRASRIASQRASICKLAGMTRLSFRVIVGESAGSILVAGVGDLGSSDAAYVLSCRDHRSRLQPLIFLLPFQIDLQTPARE